MLLPVKKRKNEHHKKILHTRISLSTNFPLKLTKFFLPDFLKKGSIVGCLEKGSDIFQG